MTRATTGLTVIDNFIRVVEQIFFTNRTIMPFTKKADVESLTATVKIQKLTFQGTQEGAEFCSSAYCCMGHESLTEPAMRMSGFQIHNVTIFDYMSKQVTLKLPHPTGSQQGML